MMTYNFDQLNDRRNSYSMKWDIKDNELPMWVADMDFQTVPAVTDAIQKRAKQGSSGPFQYRPQNDNCGRECAGTDSGI